MKSVTSLCEALSKISRATIQRIEGMTGEENVKNFLKDAINKELGKQKFNHLKP